MATEYTTNMELVSSLKIYDFKKKKNFESGVKYFYHYKEKTVLMCELNIFLTDSDTNYKPIKLIRMSEARKAHAELLLLQDIKKWMSTLTQNGHRVERLSVVLLINNSPCFRCREELGHYFESLTGRGTKLEFTLRVARLYQEGNSKKVAEEKLAFWKLKLDMQGVKVSLEAINVETEVPPSPRPRDGITERRRKHRIKLDNEIKDCIDNIKYGVEDAQMLVKREASVDERKQYLFSPEDGKQMILGRLIVSAITDTHELRPPEVIPLAKEVSDKNDDSVGEHIIDTAHSKMPEFWVSVRKTLLLVCTKVPSIKYQTKTLEFLTSKQHEKLKNKLLLYIANVPTDPTKTNKFIEWIKLLEAQSIDVCLRPLYASPPITRDPIVDRNASLKSDFQELTSKIHRWHVLQQTRRMSVHRLSLKLNRYSHSCAFQKTPAQNDKPSGLQTNF